MLDRADAGMFMFEVLTLINIIRLVDQKNKYGTKSRHPNSSETP